MKVSKTLSGLMVASVVMLAEVTSQAIPAPVSGLISFGGKATVTPTGVTSWIGMKVSSVSGFGGLVSTGDAVSLAAWSFNSGAVNNLWNVDGYMFNLTSSSVILQALGSVLVSGTGIISGNGFAPTLSTWIFYGPIIPNPSAIPKQAGEFTPPIIIFTLGGQAAPTPGQNSVPDGGTTLILLGMAFSGVAVFRKLLKKEIA